MKNQSHYLRILCGLGCLIVVFSCNDLDDKKNHGDNLIYFKNKTCSIFVDTVDSNYKKVSFSNGNGATLISIDENGNFRIKTKDASKNVIEEAYFANSSIFKLRKVKSEERGQDQFLYFDTLQKSISIKGNKSHGVIAHLQSDTIGTNESKLALINIGNYDDNVVYDIELSKETNELIEIISKKQVSSYALEIVFRPRRIGKIIINGDLVQRYYINPTKNKEMSYLLNPFILTTFAK